MDQTRLSGTSGRALSTALLLLLSLLLYISLPVRAGHDQPEEDLIYFLPILPERVKRLLDVGERIQFIDLRLQDEFQRQHLPGARSIPLKELERRHPEVPKSGYVILYCGCPPGKVEEAFAYQWLRHLGYRNVSVLQGGFNEWRKLGYPVESGTK